MQLKSENKLIKIASDFGFKYQDELLDKRSADNRDRKQDLSCILKLNLAFLEHRSNKLQVINTVFHYSF